MSKKGLNDALEKALSTAAGAGGDFLPLPLANEFISYVWDQNFVRQLFPAVKMISKTRDMPKVLGDTKVYYESTEGTEATETSMTTATIRLTAKKFIAQIKMSEEVIEDAAFDMETIVEDHFAATLAAAEEEAMIVGDPDHTPTTSTEASATTTTWFTKDHRLIFYGLLTLAADIAGSITNETRAANRVDAAGNDISTALIRQMMYNMGKYGGVFQNLVLLLNPWSSNQLMDDAKLVTIDKYGANATIVTGEFGRLYGKTRVINSAYTTDGYGVMTHVQNPMIGDRRMVKIKSEEIIQNDQRRYVISERIDFTIQHKPALCQIYDLDMPATTS
ncbi:MAG: phage major capsid protein [Candidatus Hodarchaeales archaeon]|jgi:hypothetical protein